ncbi:MAG: pyridoxal 5'-phosphate synthase glutaminase subunit PdxT [bacterium]|nr:pyridoxal 5'-phosphate synthase glutaminase subunit PdxT [bacterium]
MHCGVLALQGAWHAHLSVLGRLGATASAVRTPDELDNVDRLVLPGGESSAMLYLMRHDGLQEPLTRRIREGMPTLATCAGVILLSRNVLPDQPCLGLLDVAVERNAYGRQIASTVATIKLDDSLGSPATMEGVFIRAPRVTEVGPQVKVIGRWKEDPVLLQSNCILAATFHPELTDDLRVHRAFLDLKE